MPAATATTPRPLTSTGKAAAIIVALGSEYASSIFRFLNEEEVEKLSIEIAKMERMSPEELQAIIEDFYGLCITQKVISEGGVIYARDVLEKAFGAEVAANYIDRISASMQTRAFEFTRKANSKNMMMMIQNEYPQTIALVLSYVRAEQASKIISELPKELQIDLIKRIATIESVSPEIVAVVESIVEKRFSTMVSVDMTEVGGINYVAEVMNQTDRTTEKFIFDELGKTDPELSDNIRKLMFVFEDITKLDDMTIQRILRDVDVQDLTIAIKGSNEEVKELMLSNVSSRARENILEDMEFLRNVRLKDVEDAQQKIVNVIRTLEDAGEIVVSRGGEDAVIA